MTYTDRYRLATVVRTCRLNIGSSVANQTFVAPFKLRAEQVFIKLGGAISFSKVSSDRADVQ